MLTPVEGLDGVLTFSPQLHPDARGSFHEWFKASDFEEATGFPFDLQQANISTSRAGVLRGLHFAGEVPPGQAKFIACLSGAIFDVAVDVRVGSETFGHWVGRQLDAREFRGLYLPSGFAHGFLALSDATVCYLTSAEYRPGAEHGISPFDPELGIDWPTADYLLSEKDQAAPSLAQARDLGLLPELAQCRAFERELRDGWVIANQEAGQ